MIQLYLHILPSNNRGKGVFTSENIKSGTVLEISPVLIMEAADRIHLDKTRLHDYIFEWGEAGKQVCMALGYVPIYNHAYLSNCTYEMDYESDSINIIAVQDILKGEELFINYNGAWNDDTPIWFDVS